MQILKEGDQERAACHNCNQFCTVTYKTRNVPLSDGSGIVKNVLVGVCDVCDTVCVLPAQSTPTVKKELEKKRKSIDARLPVHMKDILSVAIDKHGGSYRANQMLIKWYLRYLLRDENAYKYLPKYLESELASGKPSFHLSIKGHNVYNDIESLKMKSSIQSTTHLMKCLILKINDDIVQDGESPEFLANVHDIIQAYE